METRIVHQGDVLLVKVGNKKPVGKPVSQNRLVLALGEVTGHSHVIEQEGCAEFLVDGKRIVWVVAPTTIHHEEHDFIKSANVGTPVGIGAWEVIQQWDKWTNRQVMD